jgi:hypothetical protein
LFFGGKMLSQVQFSTGAAAGGAGLATATAYSGDIIRGEVLAVYVDYVGSPPAATTDFTLSDRADPASEAIVSLTNAATDIKLYPRRTAESNDGTDATDFWVPYIVYGELEATIAQANDDDYCTVTVWIRRDM